MQEALKEANEAVEDARRRASTTTPAPTTTHQQQQQQQSTTTSPTSSIPTPRQPKQMRKLSEVYWVNSDEESDEEQPQQTDGSTGAVIDLSAPPQSSASADAADGGRRRQQPQVEVPQAFLEKAKRMTEQLTKLPPPMLGDSWAEKAAHILYLLMDPAGNHKDEDDALDSFELAWRGEKQITECEITLSIDKAYITEDGERYVDDMVRMLFFTPDGERQVRSRIGLERAERAEEMRDKDIAALAAEEGMDGEVIAQEAAQHGGTAGDGDPDEDNGDVEVDNVGDHRGGNATGAYAKKKLRYDNDVSDGDGAYGGGDDGDMSDGDGTYEEEEEEEEEEDGKHTHPPTYIIIYSFIFLFRRRRGSRLRRSSRRNSRRSRRGHRCVSTRCVSTRCFNHPPPPHTRFNPHTQHTHNHTHPHT